MSKRADLLLVERGLLDSRARAQAEISAGHVLVDGAPVRKPSQKISETAQLTLAKTLHDWVSRAGQKLDHALTTFGLSLEGRTVLDIGASTGGFTEVALKAGASRVLAIDVGHGQLHASLVSDPRVHSFEGLNAKDLTSEILAASFNTIVCDVSFISLQKALPKALTLAEPDSLLIALIKPQFEVGRKNIARGGIVKDASLHAKVCQDMEDWLNLQAGWQVSGICPSPIEGGDGNKEFLIVATKSK
jgi:23S rRNA (cytidine1920-2'-O)/16S rRNA (cytidine1409-2'-O)-methyltransferase